MDPPSTGSSFIPSPENRHRDLHYPARQNANAAAGFQASPSIQSPPLGTPAAAQPGIQGTQGDYGGGATGPSAGAPGSPLAPDNSYGIRDMATDVGGALWIDPEVEGLLEDESPGTGEATVDVASLVASIISSEMEDVGSDDEHEVSPDGPRTGAWYASRWGHPLYKGADVTLGQYVCLRLLEQAQFSKTDEATDAEFFADHNILFKSKEELISPPSLHLARAAAGIRDVSEFEEHFCGKCHKWHFEKITREEWVARKDEKCGHCKHPRFVCVGGKLTPTQRCFYFPLAAALRRLFSNPLFSANRTKGRNNKYGWYLSEAAKDLERLLQSLQGYAAASLLRWENSAYGIGFDFGGIFNHRQHSVGIIGIRCEDLPGHLLGKTDMCLPLAVIEGPTEPSDLGVYLDVYAKQLADLGVHGLEVEGPDGVPFVHRPVLGTLYADTMARAKLTNSMGSAAAYLACPFCWLNGTRIGTATRFLGYEKAVVTERALPGMGVRKKAFKLGENDSARLLTHDDQALRAEAVQDMVDRGVKFDPGDYGCRGDSPIFKTLPYLHRNYVWAPNFYHFAMLGAVKNFLKIMIKGDEKKPGVAAFKLKALAALQELESQFILTSDLGRPYEPMSMVRSYVVEHLVRFMEVYSVLLFNPQVTVVEALTPKAKQAWGHLRRALLHFHRLEIEIEGSEEAFAEWERRREAARRELLAYGAIMEQDLPELCTLNLHLCSCWLEEHEKNCGHLLFRNEMWVERMIQAIKPRTRTVFAKNAEVSIAKRLFAVADLESFKAKVKGTTAEELRDLRRSAVVDEAVDKADEGHPGFLLLFRGKPFASLRTEDRLVVRKGVADLVATGTLFDGLDVEEWLQSEATWAAAQVHRGALIQGTEHIMCWRESRERERMSYFVRVRWTVELKVTQEAAPKRRRVEAPPAEEERTYVAVVQYFVRLPHPIEAGKWVRVAVCDYYHHQDPIEDADTGDVLHAIHYPDDPVAGYEETAVTPLESIDTKLVGLWRWDPAAAGGQRRMLMYFTSNPGASGHIA